MFAGIPMLILKVERRPCRRHKFHLGMIWDDSESLRPARVNVHWLLMRFLWVGLFLAALCSTLYAQAEGEVESVGFEGYYRTDCRVPMTVR